MDRLDQPLLLLDVDGVLNPFVPTHQPVPAGFDEYRLHGVRVLLSRRHGEWIKELSGLFELVWATTWEDDANSEIGVRLGLPALPHIEFPQVAAWDADWVRKLPGVVQYVGDRALAWIDDGFGADEADWATKRTASAIPTLVLPIDRDIGLREDDVDQLKRFAADLAK